MKILTSKVADEIDNELKSIPEKYQADFNSIHEGLGVLWEEFEELKDEVFFGEKRAKQQHGITPDVAAKHVHKERMRKEAIQVAAMAVRFIQELT